VDNFVGLAPEPTEISEFFLKGHRGDVWLEIDLAILEIPKGWDTSRMKTIIFQNPEGVS
jgi:hypothetical protein